jgi:hypothetical protein
VPADELIRPYVIQVAAGSAYIRCLHCNTRISVSRNKLRNPSVCPECGYPLILVAEDDGTDLNVPWAVPDTNLAVLMCETFRVSRFPDKAMAEQWHRFETQFSLDIIRESIERVAQQSQGRNLANNCWSVVIAHARSRHSTAQAGRVSGGILHE